MNLFYNVKGVGDVLLAQLTEKPEKLTVDSKGDITLIHDESIQEVVAFNLFNASSYVKVSEVDGVRLTEETVDQIKQAFENNGVAYELNVDLSPKFVIGHVRTKEKHPNADKLSVCSVDVGNETLQIVCGAANIAEGQKVVVAKVGAVMPSGLVIRDAELRGVASSGMICSASELDLPNAEKGVGILVLEDDVVVGEPFSR